jgi:hypothetical protein
MNDMHRPMFEECLELIREGPDKGSVSTDLARTLQCRLSKGLHNGYVPIADHVPIALIFGVPFPASYTKNNVIEPLVLPQLMNEQVKGYPTECREHCEELPCYILMDKVKEV